MYYEKSTFHELGSSGDNNTHTWPITPQDINIKPPLSLAAQSSSSPCEDENFTMVLEMRCCAFRFFEKEQKIPVPILDQNTSENLSKTF